MFGKKGSVVWPSVGMVGGVPRARMFWRVHNYDLKNKTYSCLAVSGTDSIMVLARAWMFRRVQNYDLKEKNQKYQKLLQPEKK